jgi:hypothetical protein
MSKRRNPAPSGEKPLGALLAMGCPRIMMTDAAEAFSTFYRTSRVYDNGLLFEKTPNRIDWSYSRIFEAFKQTDYKSLALCDADVLIQGPFDPMYAAVQKAFAKGYGMVASPVMEVSGHYNIRPIPLDGSGFSFTEPFEVEYITGGFWWFDRKVVMNLPVVSPMKNTTGSYENLYFSIPPDTTEDVDLCRRIRALGYKIGGLCALTTGHMKIMPLPSLRTGMARPKMLGAPEKAPELPYDRARLLSPPSLEKKLSAVEGETP